MGQRLTCPCYSKPDNKNAHSEIVTPSSVRWQEIGVDGFDNSLQPDFTPPVARKLFENGEPAEKKLDLPVGNSQGDVATPRGDFTARSSNAASSPGLVQSLFGNSPASAKSPRAEEPEKDAKSPGRERTPKSAKKDESQEGADKERPRANSENSYEGPERRDTNRSKNSLQHSESAVSNASSKSRMVADRPGWCWVLTDKYCQRRELLPQGYQKIQSAGLVDKVRGKLRDKGFTEFAKDVEEQRIARYLVGNDLDPEKVSELLEALMKWRQEYNILEIRRKASEMPMARFPHFSEITGIVPFNPCAVVTPMGYPVAIYRIGMARWDKLKALDDSLVPVCYRYINEYLDSLIFKNSDDSQLMIGMIQIFDLKGLKPWHIGNVKLALQKIVQPVVGESTKYYVEEGYHTFLVNTPKIYMPLWWIIKLWLNSRMESKVTVAAAVPDELIEMVGKDKVPKFLGGFSSDNYGLGDD